MQERENADSINFRAGISSTFFNKVPPDCPKEVLGTLLGKCREKHIKRIKNSLKLYRDLLLEIK